MLFKFHGLQIAISWLECFSSYFIYLYLVHCNDIQCSVPEFLVIIDHNIPFFGNDVNYSIVSKLVVHNFLNWYTVISIPIIRCFVHFTLISSLLLCAYWLCTNKEYCVIDAAILWCPDVQMENNIHETQLSVGAWSCDYFFRK